MVLLHGMIKKTQTTPKADLDLAWKRMKDVAMSAEPNPHIGSSFDDFLVEQGIREEMVEIAPKRVLAFQLAQIMASEHLGPDEMAARMGTTAEQVQKLLDPTDDAVELGTLRRAAAAVGRKVRLELT